MVLTLYFILLCHRGQTRTKESSFEWLLLGFLSHEYQNLCA